MSTGMDAPLVEHFEGRHLTWYTCPAGIPTIGVGHAIRAHEQFLKKGITEQRCDSLLMSDLAVAAASVDHAVKIRLTNGQRAALISFAFNLGGGVLPGSTLIKKLNAGDYAGASSEFLRWNKADLDHDGKIEPGEELPGLTRRRKCEQFIFNGGTLDGLNAHNWFK